MSELTIGGRPAQDFIGRVIRFRSPKVAESSQHLMPGKLLEVQNDKVLIKPFGHKKTELVELAAVAPWWSRNDDLRVITTDEIDEALRAAEVEPTIGEDPPKEEVALQPESQEAEGIAKEEHMETAETITAPAPARRVKHPKLIITSEVDSDWVDVYKSYLNAVIEEAEASEVLEIARINTANLADTLRSKGVIIGESNEESKPEEPRKEVVTRPYTDERRAELVAEIVGKLPGHTGATHSVRACLLRKPMACGSSWLVGEAFKKLAPADVEVKCVQRKTVGSRGRAGWHLELTRK